MQANWQLPYPYQTTALTSLASDEDGSSSSGKAAPPKAAWHPKDRVDYWLIFSICLPIFAWVVLTQRSLTLFHFPGARSTSRSSIWSSAKQQAHHCAKLALQG